MPPVTVFTKSWCSYSQRALALLQDKGVALSEIDIEKHPERRDEMIERAGGARTVPQIFVGDIHVGGCDDLVALDAKGGLDALLAGKG